MKTLQDYEYYRTEKGILYLGDCLDVLKLIPDNSIDLICTDPPYALTSTTKYRGDMVDYNNGKGNQYCRQQARGGFMGKDWDKEVPSVDIWRECLRVLKDGAFAFVMSAPRLDCQTEMAVRLRDAGFIIGFTPIYWSYASGFPKAGNVGKLIDKKLGAEREVVGEKGLNSFGKEKEGIYCGFINKNFEKANNITAPSSPEAKALDGSYAGFQPKPAVEVIIVAMKPIIEKTYVEQALKNGHGITWLDRCRIPYESEGDKINAMPGSQGIDCKARRFNRTRQAQVAMR